MFFILFFFEEQRVFFFLLACRIFSLAPALRANGWFLAADLRALPAHGRISAAWSYCCAQRDRLTLSALTFIIFISSLLNRPAPALARSYSVLRLDWRLYICSSCILLSAIARNVSYNRSKDIKASAVRRNRFGPSFGCLPYRLNRATTRQTKRQALSCRL